MHKIQLALAGLLLGAPLLSHAQGTEPTPYKFYGGLAAYSSTYNGVSTFPGHFRLPVQATLGYQVRPRLAVQAGVAYSATGRSYTYYSHDRATGQSFNPSSGTYSNRYTSASLLARYTLTRKPEHHLQFDVLGGFTLEHYSYHDAGNQTDSLSLQKTTVTTPYDYHHSDNTFLVSAGFSARYRFGQRLELVYDLATNYDVSSSRLYAYRGFTGSTALGLRYRFGS
jgi:hypothetical protein